MAVFRRGGKWWIGYRGSDGKYRRECVGLNKKLAHEVWAKRLTEVAERREFPGRVAHAKPFGELLDKFWEIRGRHYRSPKTWGLILKEFRRVFAGKRVGDITPADVQKHYNVVAARASGPTANRHLCLLKCIFNRAKDWGDHFGENPCRRVKTLPENPARLKFLSRTESQSLLRVAHPRLYPVLVCALKTGMRRGEILGLTWENVSLGSGILHVEKTKSGKPRQIHIASSLARLLESIKPEKPEPSEKVFKLPYIMLRRYFEKAVREAGLFDFRFHDLRHTFASHYIMRTNDLPALQQLLGHSTPALTMRYAHLSSGHLRSEMDTFDAGMPIEPVRARVELPRPQPSPGVAP